MSISIVFETHSLSEDNERGLATGWLPGQLSQHGRALARELGQRRASDGLAAGVLVIGHVATRWGLDHFLGGDGLEDLVDADFGWQEGWEYELDETLLLRD